jgi:hypothetical protein
LPDAAAKIAAFRNKKGLQKCPEDLIANVVKFIIGINEA